MHRSRSAATTACLAGLLAAALPAAGGGSGTVPARQGAEPAATPEHELPAAPQEADPYREARHRMVRRTIASGPAREPVTDERVLRAMREVPRHEFVEPALVRRAYEDAPLPIGHGQTISQPYIVAYMAEVLELDPDARVLEVGTGSGYHAAVLARLAAEVHTIEIVEPLARSAAERLERLGFENVHVRHGDGYYGWQEHGPYRGIVVTAAASHIPPPLVEQLAPGGRMVIPVGPPFQLQSLMLVERRPDGSIRQRHLVPVQFVPLTRGG